MAGIAFVGVRLIAALTAVQSITVFAWSTWDAMIGVLLFAGAIVLWRSAKRVALEFTGTTNVEPWAEQWSVWALSMYGVYMLVWHIPILITRNSFGIWLTLTQIDDDAYWFGGDPIFIWASISAVLFVIGPSRVWKYVISKWESGRS